LGELDRFGGKLASVRVILARFGENAGRVRGKRARLRGNPASLRGVLQRWKAEI
jgi:hypothetical protein